MTTIVITPPDEEPVSLAEARLMLRCDPSVAERDTLISMAITAAREEAEHATGKAFVSRTLEEVIDLFPAAEIRLRPLPLVSITSIKYIDTNGDEQTLDSAAYSLDTVNGFVSPAVGYTWPETLDTMNAVRVRFVAGYGDASAVPNGIKVWILREVQRAEDGEEKNKYAEDSIRTVWDYS
jgi:uncharacterized phiE125 gp8 family phage protein